jgi:hypothetical protein
MKRTATLIVLILCLTTNGLSQTTAELFISMPAREMPLLNTNARAELLDSFIANGNAATVNAFEDTCRLIALSEDRLQLSSPGGLTELIVLTMPNESKLVCLISTVFTPVCDSRISFFTIKWKPLETGLFFKPAGRNSFIREESNASDPNGTRIPLGMDFFRYEYHPEDQSLVQEYTSPNLLNDEEKPASMVITNSVVFQWTAGRFEQK